jgi:hypothetical protein
MSGNSGGPWGGGGNRGSGDGIAAAVAAAGAGPAATGRRFPRSTIWSARARSSCAC